MSSGHDRFKGQLPGYLLGALDPGERVDLEHHLDGCAECRAELAWLEPSTRVLAADVEQVEPSPGLRRRVMAAVEADLEADPVDEPSFAAPSRERSGRPERDRGGWLAGLLRPAVFGAVAAALFVGAVIGVALDDGGDPGPGPAPQVITGSSNIGADATLVASNGAGTLKITGLRRPDEDQVYQAWIQRGQTIEPTDSLFVPRRDGTATASIPDLDGVDAVMVSAEPKGGSEQPTSAPVITVSVPG